MSTFLIATLAAMLQIILVLVSLAVGFVLGLNRRDLDD